jgi:putative ABC transport system permease protein
VLRSLMLRAARLFRRERVERELDEELGYHLELSAREHAARGASAEEARRLAAIEFGGHDRYREEYRDASGVRWLEDAAMDAAYAIRSLRRSPVFAVTAIGTLGIGIATAAAVFAVAGGVLRPLPWADSDRLVRVWQSDAASESYHEASSVPDYFDYVERTRTLESLAAYADLPRSLTLPGSPPERVLSIGATHSFAELLAIPFTHGRWFTAAEDALGADGVVVVSNAFWQSRLNRDPAAVGRPVRLDGREYTVIGVLAPGREYPGPHIDLWEPLAATPTSGPRHTHDVNVIARVAPGSTAEQADAEIRRIMAELEEEYPQSNTGRGGSVEPLHEVMVGGARTPLLVLLAAVTLLLVMACASVANLLLARHAARARETAIRSALGAGRLRLTRQWLLEALGLSFAAGLVGLGLAWLAVRALFVLQPQGLPRLHEVAIGPSVLAAVALACLAIALLFTLLPMLHSRRPLDRSALHAARGWGTASHPRLRRALVTLQLALCLVLLIGAGLLVRSFTTVAGIDPGFTAEQVLKAEFQLPDTRYPRDFSRYPDWPEVQQFYGRVLADVGSVPGVVAAALAAHHPLHIGFTNSFTIPGRPQDSGGQPEIRVRAVSAGYLDAVGARLVAGRGIEDGDHATAAAVALLNEAAAALHFPDEDALGRSITFWGTERRIVGIVADERIAGLAEPAPAAVYTPLPQTPMHTGVLLIRTALPPLSVAGDVRRVLARVDPELALFAIEPLDRTLAASIARERLLATLFATFAAAALLLGLAGVYGLVAYLFAQRVHELGIRSALGATPTQLRAIFMKEGMVLALAGTGAGLFISLLASRGLAALLFGVDPTDPFTWTIAVLLLLAIAALASWLPARRAGRSSPLTALNTGG